MAAFKNRNGGWELLARNNINIVISRNWILLLSLASFCAGMFFTNSRMWRIQADEGRRNVATAIQNETSGLASEAIDNSNLQIAKHVKEKLLKDMTKPQETFQNLKSKISNLETKFKNKKASNVSRIDGNTMAGDMNNAEPKTRHKYLMVVGINTGFTGWNRREAVRSTWMPQGDKRKKLEEEKGVVIRFVIGRSSESGADILDKAIEAENREYGDILKLDHFEGYMKLSAKTKTYFSTAISLWDADFYIKVDDDVHVNLGELGQTLASYRGRPRVYVGCMKSGPVLHQEGVKYHEPEYWKFGEKGNKYFRHACGQLYAISNDLAEYIRSNEHMLHKYANEDVTLGAWLLGLDVEYIDDKRICCGTPPGSGADSGKMNVAACDWSARMGITCIAVFDWQCSGICRAPKRMMQVHQQCGENEDALWTATF